MVTCSKINERSVGLFGNKLFIIAALIGLAIRNNDEVILPGAPTWEYGHCFKNKIKTLPNLPLIKNHYIEPYFHYKEIPYKPDMDIQGFFQSEKYFKDVEDEVRHYYEPTPEIIQKIKTNYPMVWNEECISIHVRRNDYLYYQEVHHPCSIQYYTEAMNNLPKPDKFIVFSDDINWCKSVFVSESNDVIFSENQTNFEDMFLMSFCKHHIIANSSFSWWGSWLNKNRDKITIFPKKWFGPKGPQNWNDIYPKSGKVMLI